MNIEYKVYEINLVNPVEGQMVLSVDAKSYCDADDKFYDLYNIVQDDYYGSIREVYDSELSKYATPNSLDLLIS